MTLIEQLEGMAKALNAQEVATLLGISKQHIYEMVADGSIPAFHVGRSIRFDSQELADWLRRMKPHIRQGSKGKRDGHEGAEPGRSPKEVATVHHIWRKRVHHLTVAAASK